MKAFIGILVTLLTIASPVLADGPDRFTLGGDQYVSGQEATLSGDVENDAFAAGFNVVVPSPVSGDVHAGGFTVTVSGPVSGNVYAVGNAVTLSGPVGKDVTALGGTITLSGSDAIKGNLRVTGGSIALDRPVDGSALVAGHSVAIDGPIAGDLVLSTEAASFGDNAKVLGHVDIRSTSPIEVPASVAPADRVTFTKVETTDIPGDAKGIFDKATDNRLNHWMFSVFGAAAAIIYGIALLALFPRRIETGFQTGMAKPIKSLLFGILALSAYIGLVLVLLLTLIGIPLAPFAVILAILAGLTGFIMGGYFLTDRIFSAFGFETDSLWKRALALVVGLIVAGIVGAIPFLGWIAQLGLCFFGLGALSFASFGRRIDSDFHRQLARDTGLKP